MILSLRSFLRKGGRKYTQAPYKSHFLSQMLCFLLLCHPSFGLPLNPFPPKGEKSADYPWEPALPLKPGD